MCKIPLLTCPYVLRIPFFIVQRSPEPKPRVCVTSPLTAGGAHSATVTYFCRRRGKSVVFSFSFISLFWACLFRTSRCLALEPSSLAKELIFVAMLSRSMACICMLCAERRRKTAWLAALAVTGPSRMEVRLPANIGRGLERPFVWDFADDALREEGFCVYGLCFNVGALGFVLQPSSPTPVSPTDCCSVMALMIDCRVQNINHEGFRAWGSGV